jgi:hypothetical protein
MKGRIRSELRVGTRFDAELDGFINDAINAFRSKRFWWAESRTAAAFNTVAAQEFYGIADVPAFARLISIDYVVTTIGTQPFQLTPYRPLPGETASNGTSTGQPISYTWYENQLRIHPIPSGVFPIRVAGLFSAAAPADDNELSNPWMTTAERLIRSRSKAEIALHRMRDRDLASDMVAATDEALSQLREETTSKTETGTMEAIW